MYLFIKNPLEIFTDTQTKSIKDSLKNHSYLFNLTS